eukprot:GHVS01088431.1.p1 GENE.GHVS01088431.1~~GHVS01088431.1.p1  ORF type:complete len:321 (+),score=20.99 GHVS01088431.1:152-1114(+)
MLSPLHLQLPPPPHRTIGSAMDDTHKNPNKVFVGGLGQCTTSVTLSNYFSQFGRVVDAAVVTDKNTLRSRGFGFCSFASEGVAERCLQMKHRIDGVQVEIRPSVPREEARSNPSYDSVEQAGKVHVSKLSDSMTESQLKNFFERFGQVETASIVYDKANHRPRGFGFIVFTNAEDASSCIGQHNYEDSQIEVKKAIPRTRNTSKRSVGFGWQSGRPSAGVYSRYRHGAFGGTNRDYVGPTPSYPGGCYYDPYAPPPPGSYYIPMGSGYTRFGGGGGYTTYMGGSTGGNGPGWYGGGGTQGGYNFGRGNGRFAAGTRAMVY